MRCDGCGKDRRDVQSVGRDANGDPDAPDLCFLCRQHGAPEGKNLNDCVWYWTGGNAIGRWNLAIGADLDALRTSLRRMGYVAHKGSQDIGAPEGPPTCEDFRNVMGF
jgi:hypothetical protein